MPTLLCLAGRTIVWAIRKTCGRNQQIQRWCFNLWISIASISLSCELLLQWSLCICELCGFIVRVIFFFLISHASRILLNPLQVSQHSYSMSHQRLENPTKDGDYVFKDGEPLRLIVFTHAPSVKLVVHHICHSLKIISLANIDFFFFFGCMKQMQ